MELQFNKSVIQCLQTVVRESQTQELTQEIKLTDGMPDIGRVLISWGQMIIRSKEWRSGGMSVSGGVMVWTLYVPEDGGPAQSVESWLPFQMRWDFPDTERDGAICVLPILRGADARCISARKLMVRAGIGISGEAVIPQEVEVFQPGEMPQDIQLLKRTYPMQIPKEAGEKAFSLDVDLLLPANAPALEKIISYELRFELRETKLVGDKLVFRGVAIVHLRYRSTNGEIHGWDLEVPFSQYAELDAEHNENAQVRICFAVTGLELDQGAEENLTLKAGVIGQYTIYDRCMVEVAEDAYSTSRQVDMQMTELELPAVLELRTELLDVDKSVETDCMRCADIAFCSDFPRVYRENEKLCAELSGTVQMLGYDADGELKSVSSRWESGWSMPLSSEAGAEIMVIPSSGIASVNGDRVNVHNQLKMDVVTARQSEIPMLKGLEVGENVAPDPGRPSVILRRAGNQSLWEMAKNLGSTVEDIQKANHLQQEPKEDQMLLIPIL